MLIPLLLSILLLLLALCESAISPDLNLQDIPPYDYDRIDEVLGELRQGNSVSSFACIFYGRVRCGKTSLIARLLQLDTLPTVNTTESSSYEIPFNNLHSMYFIDTPGLKRDQVMSPRITLQQLLEPVRMLAKLSDVPVPVYRLYYVVDSADRDWAGMARDLKQIRWVYGAQAAAHIRLIINKHDLLQSRHSTKWINTVYIERVKQMCRNALGCDPDRVYYTSADIPSRYIRPVLDDLYGFTNEQALHINDPDQVQNRIDHTEFRRVPKKRKSGSNAEIPPDDNVQCRPNSDSPSVLARDEHSDTELRNEPNLQESLSHSSATEYTNPSSASTSSESESTNPIPSESTKPQRNSTITIIIIVLPIVVGVLLISLVCFIFRKSNCGRIASVCVCIPVNA